MTEEIEKYINSHYQRWYEYAAYHCNISQLNIDPAEVLNNILCDLLAERPETVAELIGRKGKNGLTEFDYFLVSAIRTNIISPRSNVRYVKGQKVTGRIGLLEYRIADEREDDNEQYEEQMQIVRSILADLQITEQSKRIFSWRFFEGQNFKDWNGHESLDYLYDTYNRVELLIRYEVWRKSR